MIDQAKRLRELAEQIKADKEVSRQKSSKRGRLFQRPIFKQTRVIAVTSGKGGVGKTNLTVNLALALSRHGQRVTIFDADLGLANIDVVMGVTPEHTLQQVLQGEMGVLDIISEGPENTKIIANGSGIAELANMNSSQRNHFINQMLKLEGYTDILLIDTGAGISRNVLGFILAASEVIVVTTPEPTAIMDAYGIIKIISNENRQAQLRLVVNMVQDAAEANKVQKKLLTVSKQFLNIKLQDFGYISQDSNIRQAIRDQVPIMISNPESVAAKCIAVIAARLLNKEFVPLEDPEQPAGLSGFFRKMFTTMVKND